MNKEFLFQKKRQENKSNKKLKISSLLDDSRIIHATMCAAKNGK